MATSPVTTVKQYLDALPEERRTVVKQVRSVIKRHLPKGYREAIGWGMIVYAIPLSRYPKTYNGLPLCYAALAAQKNYFALYLMSAYGDRKQAATLKEAFRKAGKKLDMGKSCVRFRKLDDLPLDAIGAFIARTPPEAYIKVYEASRKKTR
jgi:hypothetical protein